MDIANEIQGRVLPTARARALTFFQTVLLGLVLLSGVGIRLYDLKDPPLDFHPTRQLRSAIIARGMYYQMDRSADPDVRGRAIDIANSMEAYEPPIFEGLVAVTYLAAGQEILWVSRVWSAIFWLVGGLALFALGRRFASFYAALIGLMFYGFLPFAVIASRSFQPDPWMVMWMLLALWAMYRWAETDGWKWALLSGLFGGMAVLVKAVAALPVAAALLGLVVGVTGLKRTLSSPRAWCMGFLLVTPSLFYYILDLGARSGSFLSFWTGALSHLVLTTHFYAEWLGMLHGLFGLTNLLLALIGVFVAAQPVRSLLAGAWLGYFLYGLVFPYQMITHTYYHIQVTALIALSLIPLVHLPWTRLMEQKWAWRAAAAGLLAFASIYCLYSARSAMLVSRSGNEAIAWKRVGEAVPSDGRVIALTSEYGNRLKYFGWRSVAAYWPTGGDLNLSQMAGNAKNDFASAFKEAIQGNDYFLVTAFSELDAQPELKQMLNQHYPVYKQGDGYVLYDLRRYLP